MGNFSKAPSKIKRKPKVAVPTGTAKETTEEIALFDIHKTRTALEETKLAEKNLAIARADAINIIESNPIPYIVIKADRSILFANYAFFEKFYPHAATTMAEKKSSLVEFANGPWNTPDLAELINKTLHEGVEFNNFEIKHNFPEIGNKAVLLNSKRIILPGSAIEATVIAFEDITDRKNAEQDKATALRLLQQVAGGVPGLVYQYLVNADGSSCFPFASEGIRKIYQLTPEEVRKDGAKVISKIHPDDRDSYLASMQKSANDLSPWTLEYRVKDEDGKIRWLLGSGIAERCAQGVLWNGYITDITKQKMSEQALKASEEKYRNLAATSFYGVMVLRCDGSVEFTNSQLEKLFGYNPGELLNQNHDILIVDRNREAHSNHHAQYMTNPVQREMGRGLDLNGRKKDGTEFPIDVSLSPFKVNNDVFVNCSIRDISVEKTMERSRKHLAVQEKALRDEAIRSNRNKDEFLATLSHELRTPLTTILGWTQQLMLKNLDSEVRDALVVIERSAKAQGQLVDDLLDVSRIHAGKISLNMQVIDLAELLKLALKSASVLASKKEIQFESSLPATSCNILGDPNRLQQIFWNIFTNAIKFTPNGGKVSVQLQVDEWSPKRVARVQVSDTGMGIKAELLTHIFQRFSQVDSSMTRVYGGLGLGLAIVKSLVAHHKGTIEAKSEGEGKGSTFTVTLPMANRKLSENQATDSQSLSVRLDGLKILVIDDNIDNLYLFDVILKSLGAEVRTGESAQQCLEILPMFMPDILLSDISMPGEDGYSLIRKIRALPENQGGKVPAIALTAYASPEDVKIALDAGFSGHVAKPIDKQLLTSAIKKIIQI